MDKGIHPVKVADGFEQACKVAVDYLSEIATTIDFSEDNIEPLVEVALTTLSSKIVNKYYYEYFWDFLTFRFKRQMAEIAVRSVLAVADLERRDVRFDLIKLIVFQKYPRFMDRQKQAEKWKTQNWSRVWC